MKEPTEAQIEEFWEGRGFTQVKNVWPPAVSGKNWIYPGGLVFRDLPPIDLNNLFKYAIPKLGEGAFDALTSWAGGLCYQDSEDPALALFWAIKENL